MKTINQFITEKFKLSVKNITKKNKQWSIENAEDGDFVHCLDTLIFIYKCLNENKQYSYTDENAIVYHAAFFNDNRKKVVMGPDTGVGSPKSKYRFQLATDEEIEEFKKALYIEGYKWDDKKLKIVKI